MSYGRINEWVVSYDGRYVTGWIMGLRRRVNGRRTLWRLVNMTVRELTELQEKSRNTDHTSAIMHMVETNGRNELDHSRRWIAAGNGLPPEMVNKRWILSGGGSRQDMDRDQLWMDDRRWRTGDGSREMDHGRQMTINLLPF